MHDTKQSAAISFASIKIEYQRALDECRQVLAACEWVHKPDGIELTNHKTKYGMASRDGVTFINKAFVGTHCINKLRNTLRHELAHLAVGLDQHHNAIFKQCASLFGATAAIDKTEIHSFLNNIKYKWLVVAYLVDGTISEIGKMHRKSRRYTEYPGNGYRFTINGVEVHRFEFSAV